MNKKALEALQTRLDGLEASVKAAFPGKPVARLSDALILHLEAGELVESMVKLRDDPALDFKLLIDLTAVHYPGCDPELDVVYQLLSVHKNHRLRVKVGADANRPVPSVCGVWSCANWFERETYEMFGLPFTGHPDLRRLLTDYDFDGHPLRKDFPGTGYWELRYDEEQKRIVREPTHLERPNREFYGKKHRGWPVNLAR